MFGWIKSKKIDKTDNSINHRRIEHFENPSDVLRLFTAHTGIHFHQKEAITVSKLISFCRDHSIFSFEELYQRLTDESLLFEALINTLTVNETYFFREMGQIEFLSKRFVQHPRHYRILCAPGSTGEEPYTIAISLLEHGISAHQIEIVSVDINSRATQKAIKGEYSKRSLHKVSEPIKEKYFDLIDDHYKIDDNLKKMVNFYQINIFDESFLKLGVFDAIFSRNMLIYFDEKNSAKAILQLSKLAAEEDCLFFFGHADLVHPPKDLQEHYEEGVRFFTL